MSNHFKKKLWVSSALIFGAISTSALTAQTAVAADGATHAFYVVTNKANGNSIVGYEQSSAGKYRRIGEYFTDGNGTGDLEIPSLKKDATHPLANGDDPLISANSLASAKNGKHIIVVNPGDATISLMGKNADNTLKYMGKAKATDLFPISVAAHGRYVVAASVGKSNGHGSIGVYKIKRNSLEFIEGSRRDLGARPSTISFANNGKTVIVNELVTGKIKSFSIRNGVLSDEPVSVIESPRGDETRFQAVPVGFAIRSGRDFDTVLMSEARFLTPDFKLRAGVKASMGSGMMKHKMMKKGMMKHGQMEDGQMKDGQIKDGMMKKGHMKMEMSGMMKHVVQSPLYSWQTGSLSTYKLDKKGQLSLIDGDVMTGKHVEGGELANCWVALSHDGERLWTVNALSSSISAFDITDEGKAVMADLTAYKDDSEQTFLSDIALSVDGDELYQLVGNKGEVLIFDIAEDQSLSLKQTIGGLPVLGSYGLLPF